MKATLPRTGKDRRELERLRERLGEAEATLQAIRAGEVDAVVVGQQVYSLEGAETPYRRLIEAMHEGAATLAADGTVLYCNGSLAALLARSPHELMGSPLRDQVAPPDRPAFDTAFARSLTGLDKSRLQLRRAAGSLVPVQLSLVPLAAHDHGVRCAVVTDLTDFTRAREEILALNSSLEARVAARTRDLAESEERLRAVLEASATGTFEVDLRTGEAMWNDEEYRLLGLLPGALPSNVENFFRFVHPEDVAALRQRWVGALQGGVFDAEFRIVRPDGEERWLAGKGHFAFDTGEAAADGTRSGRFLGVNFDITARKRAEAERRASEERHRLLFETAVQGIVYHDAEGRITAANEAAGRIFGRPAPELVGGRCLAADAAVLREDGTRFPESEDPALVALRTGHEVCDVVLGIPGPQRDVLRWVRVNAMPLFRPGGERPSQVYAILVDITAQRTSEEQIRRLNEQLSLRAAAVEAANQELETFAYSVSHDLRAPLRSIAGFSRILVQDHAARLGDDGRGHLDRICAATSRMDQLIDDILKLSRISRAELHRQGVDLGALARSVVEELRAHEPTRTVEFSAGDGLRAEGDPHLLRIVLENLLDNAWKFTGRSTAARIEFGGEVGGSEARFFVRDNGAGFDPAYAGKLFGAFQRLHSAAEFPGNGIGLATVQRIVRRHGGRVWAEGSPGQGATFWFTLPRETSRQTNPPYP